MRTRVLSSLLLIALAACGGGSEPTHPVTPPDPKPPRVALITYSTDTALVFTSKHIPVRALVRAYDSTGAELPSSRLTLTLPAGWTRQGDTLVASSAESQGKLLASAATSSSVSASVIASAANETLLTSGIDLRQFGWTASWKCAQTGTTFKSTGGIPVDSMVYSGAKVDSVTYPGDLSFVPNFGGVAQLWWGAEAVQYLRDGSADTLHVVDHITVARQAPDSLLIDAGSFHPVPAVRQGASGRTYVGASFCSPEWETRGVVTIVGSAKSQ